MRGGNGIRVVIYRLIRCVRTCKVGLTSLSCHLWLQSSVFLYIYLILFFSSFIFFFLSFSHLPSFLPDFPPLWFSEFSLRNFYFQLGNKTKTLLHGVCVCVCDIIRCVCVSQMDFPQCSAWRVGHRGGRGSMPACSLSHVHAYAHTHTQDCFFSSFFSLIPGHMIPFMVFWVKEKYLSSICNHHLSVSLLLNKCLLLLYDFCRLKTTLKNIFLQFYVLKYIKMIWILFTNITAHQRLYLAEVLN